MHQCYLKREYGQEGLHWWKEAKGLVEMKGISEKGYTLEEVLSGNRAGPNETELTVRELITAYCKRESLGEWSA